MKLSGKAKWIIETGSEMAGRELNPERGLGKMLLDLGQKIKAQGGGLSSRQVIGLAVMVFEMNRQSAEMMNVALAGVGRLSDDI